ncbi:TonB-dependent receptor [Rosettibacter firmus]|uniref:TonB-dependent receptor n=1 Tax=Rosettibacter firmus TaxID=3111522 RepID=UPI00336C261B
MKKIFVLLIVILSLDVYAQTGNIKGRVINESAQPVIGANVIIEGTFYGAATDENGNFEIKNIPFGNYVLRISSIGYEKRSIKINFNQNFKPLTIILKTSVIETQQIVVSAGKYEQKKEDLTVSTTVIQPEFINRKNYKTFDELLRDIPGIQMNLEQVSIRGSSGYSKGVGARVLAAINGIPFFSGDNGDVVWEMIPLADIERVEIIKGPASSLYGTSAIGGVINIITSQPVKSPITNINSYYGIYDKPKYESWRWNKNYRSFYGIEVTHSNSIENLGYTFSLKKFDDLSYKRDNFSKKYLGYLKMNYKLNNKSELTLFTDYLNMNRGNFLYWKDSRHALVPKDEDTNKIVKSNRVFSGLIYHNKLSDNLTGDFKFSYYYTRFDGYGLEVTTSEANLFRSEALFNYNVSEKLLIVGGVEASYSNVKSNIFSNTKFRGFATYFQTEYKAFKNFIATLGIRYDYIDLIPAGSKDTISGKNAITPRAGLNYKLSDKLILRASIGTGFRAPTPAEVFTTAGVGGGIDIKENPNLKSETSFSIETGALYNYSSNLSFDVALYRTEYNNFIEPNLNKEGKIQFVNLTKARILGVEIITDLHIIPSLLKVMLGYNYMWARDIEKKKAMKYRPRNSFNLQLRLTPLPYEFGIDFRYASKVEEIDFEITQPPLALVIDGDKRVPVYVTDITAGYNFIVMKMPAKIYLNAKNIFNYYYVEFIGNLAPLRNISLNFQLYL